MNGNHRLLLEQFGSEANVSVRVCLCLCVKGRASNESGRVRVGELEKPERRGSLAAAKVD